MWCTAAKNLLQIRATFFKQKKKVSQCDASTPVEQMRRSGGTGAAAALMTQQSEVRLCLHTPLVDGVCVRVCLYEVFFFFYVCAEVPTCLCGQI